MYAPVRVCVCVCLSLGFIGRHKVQNELMIPVNCQHTIYLYILPRNRSYRSSLSHSACTPLQLLLLLLLICRTFIRANY